ncbi:MAG: FABP family protein [Aeromicrobium sp.]|uniref:FABP family protein n=1 Tax=Aeromicrobium sp. TaxID=1871063 RepID=UPI0039E29A4F
MAFEIPSDLHPSLVPVAWLLGTWHGNGKGEYPGTEPLSFEQEAIFAHDTRDFLHYFSRSWVTDDQGNRQGPGALETGFLRPAEEGLELVLVHASGHAEVWYGEIDGPRLKLVTDLVARTPTASEYTAGQRLYGLVEGKLMYAYDKAADGHEMQSYLWGQLERV